MSCSHRRLLLAALLALCLAGCASLTASLIPTATAGTPNVAVVSTVQPTPGSERAITLNLWLPPQFDPGSGSLAAGILQTRLDEFTGQHPQVLINVRIKDESGPGGLLESMVRSQVAAPLALPDVVLMPASLLPEAAAAGVLHPQNALSNELGSNDWYPFAVQLATVEDERYGLPFMADGLVTAHRSTAISQVPPTWVRLMDTRIALGFAAADSQARFPLMQLLSLPGNDGDTIAERNLLELFDFFATGQARGVFPFWLTQYQSNEQTWQAFSEGRLPMVTAWTSQVFANRQTEISGAPLPTQNGQPFTLVRGWAWSVATQNTERAALATELIEFLSTPEFLAQYSAAASLLPPRPSALAAWAPGANQALASQLVNNARPLPDRATTERWGAALSEAVVAVLKQEMSAADAAESVSDAFAP
ncbi:MAG: extracellular solute-binding protein [Anaerolineales bacterium]|nr:MAG: extracellular solute-binding protein [Anaerolineales bacterium]